MKRYAFLFVTAVVLSLLLPLVSTPSYADVLTVPGDYGTIQAAINASVDGDEIVVSPGTYVENIILNGQDIVLRSTDPTDPDVVANTIIDGNEAGSVVTFSGTETPDCVLSGLTITNGYAEEDGGGICGNGTLATIENNVISDNRADDDGGGLSDCHGIIGSNRISHNRGHKGGGLSSCAGIIHNNTISGNRSQYGGGGLFNCDGTIQNNIISLGSSTWRGGAGLAYCDGIIQNNTIYGNLRHGGLHECDGTISNCIIWGNSPYQLSDSARPAYSCIQDWTDGGEGNISDDPLLVDPSNGDYHLLPDSPCIDAGYPYYLAGEYAVDIDGETRLAGASVDMGSDEYASSPDSDGDLLSDADETAYGTDPYNADTDEDGLQDGLELLRGTDPALHDVAPGIHVPQDMLSIEVAVFLAFPSEAVTVAPGTYYENVHFPGKNVILRSTNPLDPDVVANTILNGNGTGSVVVFSGDETPDCVLSGLTITNGHAEYGGGVYGNFTRATIRNNIISGNSAGEDGGGLAKCSGTIEDNTVSDNSAYSGGGGICWYVTHRTNIIEGDTAALPGGGLSSCGTIRSNTITGNTAAFGGGLYGCDGMIQDNTISQNSAHQGGGLYDCNGTIEENLISGNSAADYGGGLVDCDGVVRDNIISDSSGSGVAYCDGTIEGNTISDNSGGGVGSCDGTIEGNTISDNSGGGITACHGTIRNNIISGNYTEYSGGGLHNCDGTIRNNTISHNSADGRGGGLGGCQAQILNCIIWGNSAGEEGDQLHGSSTPLYSCIQDWGDETRGNISADPRFVDQPNGDYHLRADSPCIDAGNPYYFFEEHISDIDGECRIAGLSVDMGSDEHGSSPDSDGDLLPDIDEVAYGSDPDNPDSDGDGLRDGVEVLRGTDPTFEDAPSGISVPTDAPSIQGGFWLAFPSETVTVSPGMYNENLRFAGKDIVLRSTDPTDPEVVANTIIDGNGEDSVVIFSGDETPDCVLSGFTITNGYAPNGGGICGNGTLATIQNNRITGNTAYHTYPLGMTTTGNGGGVYDCGGTVRNNIISANSAALFGGGLCWCSGAIERNTILNNWTYSWFDVWWGNLIGGGGGLATCSGVIRNNVLSGNSSALDGGGLYKCNGSVNNNTLFGNAADRDGGGAFECEGEVVNCIIWANSAGSDGDQLHGSSTPLYSCIQHWTEGGEGNISSEPRFLAPSNDDFHLLSSSPCIDAARYIDGLFDDFEGDARGYDGTDEPRGDGSDYDIGADEYGEYVDTDGDVLPDWVETGTGIYVNPIDTGTDPNNPDTDGDGLADGDEVYTYSTNPNLADTDGDGLSDGEEVDTYATNPLSADTDGDGYTDGTEVAQGTDPLDPASHPGPIIPPPPPPPTTQPTTGGRGGAGGPSCFIATAAYGTPTAGEISVLSDFRDRYLLTNRVGTAFVRAYYRVSPPLARFIAQHEPLRAAARAVLTPIVAIAKLTMTFPLSVAALLAGFAVAVSRVRRKEKTSVA